MNVLESLHQKQENDADLQKDVRYAASEVMTVNSRMNETENTTDAAGNAKKSPAGNSPSAGNAVTPISVPLASAGNGSANVSALNRLMDDQDLYLRLSAYVSKLEEKLSRINSIRFQCQSGRIVFNRKQMTADKVFWSFPMPFLETPALSTLIRYMYLTRSWMTACTVKDYNTAKIVTHPVVCGADKHRAWAGRGRIGNNYITITEASFYACGYVHAPRPGS